MIRSAFTPPSLRRPSRLTRGTAPLVLARAGGPSWNRGLDSEDLEGLEAVYARELDHANLGTVYLEVYNRVDQRTRASLDALRAGADLTHIRDAISPDAQLEIHAYCPAHARVTEDGRLRAIILLE